MAKKILMLISISLLFGCATEHSIVENAYKYNIAVEETHNRVLLLNILRAYKQRPMYFTSLQKFTGSRGWKSGQLSLSIPFGPDANDAYSLSPSSSYATTPSFDVVVLDEETFMKGILTPVKMKTVKYYLDQGWPKDFVLHMFVREIQIIEEDGTGSKKLIKSIVNYPPDQDKYEEFRKEIRALVVCGLTVVEKDDTGPFGPPLSTVSASNLEHLVQAAKEKLAVAPINKSESKKLKIPIGTYLKTPGSHLTFSHETVDNKCIEDNVDNKALNNAESKVFQLRSETSETPKSDTHKLDKKNDTKKNGTTNGGKDKYARFLLRSPEAMLYYLGEVVRAQLNDDPSKCYIPNVFYESEDVPLFVVKEIIESSNADAILSTEYDDVTYAIPRKKDTAGRSMHALSLITQIMGQHKNIKDFPTTGTVNLIGQ